MTQQQGITLLSDSELNQETSFWRLMGHMDCGLVIAASCTMMILVTLFCYCNLDLDKTSVHTKNLSFYLKKADRSQLVPDLKFSSSLPLVKVAVNNHGELLKELKRYRLWEIDETKKVPPVVFTRYPAGNYDISNDQKKRIFLRTLLPAFLLVREEIRKERESLLALLDHLADSYPDTVRPNSDFWRTALTREEWRFIERLTEKYRTDNIDELLVRVRDVPVSLMLAQAAIESSWGSSRFAFLGNNLFGMWTWNELGIIPDSRDADKNHRIAVYDSLLSSIRDYALTLNRLPAYHEFRRLRLKTMDPFDLARGLGNYSEKRTAYIEDLHKILRTNQLHEYDRLDLWFGEENTAASQFTQSHPINADKLLL